MTGMVKAAADVQGHKDGLSLPRQYTVGDIGRAILLHWSF